MWDIGLLKSGEHWQWQPVEKPAGRFHTQEEAAARAGRLNVTHKPAMPNTILHRADPNGIPLVTGLALEELDRQISAVDARRRCQDLDELVWQAMLEGVL